MFRTDARRWLALEAAAFLLRAGLAVLTEHHPLFPPYYYQDATFTDNLARDMVGNWKAGRSTALSYSPSQRLHILLTAAVYRVTGARLLAPKIIQAMLGAAGVLILGFAFSGAFSPGIGLAAAAMVALWPSHAYYTSQNLKEGPVMVLVWLAFAALMIPRKDERLGPARAALGIAALVLSGLLRSYAMLAAVGALALGAAWSLLFGGGRRAAVAVLTCALCAPLAYKATAALMFDRMLSPSVAGPTSASNLIPVADDASGVVHSPLSPEGLTRFRQLRQYADRDYAMKTQGRDIATQIEPDARFDNWWQVAAFAPRAAFQVLFQPLPGLYPMDGKLGRRLAAAENTALLAISLLAVFGLARRALTEERLVFVAFFAAMALGSALLEFDLGSAGRHKLLYLPMLFPFAAEEALRLLRRKESA